MTNDGFAGALGEREVRVWLVPAEEEPIHALLSAEEAARFSRFRRAADAHLFAVGRSALRLLLSRHAAVPPADWAFRENAFGRPEVAAPGGTDAPLFNVSHAAGLVAVALARTEVGVDVERLAGAEPDPGLVRACLSPAERDALSRLPECERAGRFLELWTLKEAYVKALGVGHSFPVDQVSFEIRPGGHPRAMLRGGPADDLGAWRFRLLDAGPEHRGALAVRAGGAEPEVVVRRARFAALRA